MNAHETTEAQKAQRLNMAQERKAYRAGYCHGLQHAIKHALEQAISRRGERGAVMPSPTPWTSDHHLLALVVWGVIILIAIIVHKR